MAFEKLSSTEKILLLFKSVSVATISPLNKLFALGVMVNERDNGSDVLLVPKAIPNCKPEMFVDASPDVVAYPDGKAAETSRA